MALLKSLKKQIGQFVQSEEVEPLDPATLQIYPQMEAERSFSAENVKRERKEPQSFEVPVTNAYSHGLEEIYQLEQVDVKSIRKMSSCQPVYQESIPENPTRMLRVSQEMDFGFLPEGRRSIDSFVLDEPVMVLGLSQHVETLFSKMNIVMLRDLMNLDSNTLVHIKGMGQGHIEEVKDKLKKYIDGRPLFGCCMIDYESWVKSLIPSAQRKRAYILLEQFDLSNLISLSPPESVEIRRLSLEQREDWIAEAKELFNTYDRRRFLEGRFSEVIEVFLKPWMVKRFGFSTRLDLLERLERLSVKKGVFHKAHAFFSDVFYTGQSPLEKLMGKKEGDLFFAHDAGFEDFQFVMEAINPYFYKKGVCYPVAQLIDYVEKELSKNWKGFQTGFVKRVIFSCDAFTFSQTPESGLIVYRKPH
ncbi:DNA-directed RNA polymerase subunit alpha C-terminal domain-containing protein [Estrella lausannensis]|uniref:RNA polymerase alpha subunit C-terminal domain-containing protein n=1 Tax=Estrella lausannensis TaxID=483423 RepID=A0A0H5DP86_9BACT|nr:DNA-directed RNA polymerase subunit alpha C-terminal domain-containing protein [Estrella lausannensis]CRX38326.1 Conserved hypothetical protein [Estrella lausannensis]